MNQSSPDLTYGIIHTIYATFIHNYILFAYLFGFSIALIMAFKKPSRYSLFLILGFATLAFSFEYDKHIIEGLREQTVQSLIIEKPHYTVQKWVSVFIGEILPLFFYALGWIFVYLAVIIGGSKKHD